MVKNKNSPKCSAGVPPVEKQQSTLIESPTPHQIAERIFTLRGAQVLLDRDLAEMYQVETKTLNRAVQRNIHRFPAAFSFQLSAKEWTDLRCQSSPSKSADSLRFQFGTLKSPGRGRHRKYLLANAVYHRSYEDREPIEVRVMEDEILIQSFPGPDRSIRMDELRAGRPVARRYRNRRIGEFLKELEFIEGRNTGIPTILRVMHDNGSPEPRFETDEDRSYFLVRLPLRSSPIPQTAQVTAQVVSDFKKLKKNDLLNIEKVFPTVTAQVTAQVLLYCQIPRAAREIMVHLGLSHWKTFQTNYLKPLMEAGAIERTIPNKPKSPLQKYRLTNTSLNWLETIKT